MVEFMDGIKINHNIIKHFREKFGFSIDDIVRFAKIKDIKEKKNNHSISAINYMMGIEDGTINPTKNVLKNLAAFYHIPFLTFFLSEPPVFDDNLIDFRTFNSHPTTIDNPIIFAIKRKVKLLQAELSSIEKELSLPKKDFVSSINVDISPEDFVHIVREKLDFSLDQQQKIKKEDNLFKIIRNKIENIGIFVIQIKNLGSYHTDVKTSEFRGISISDEFAPMIVVNPNDNLPAQLFSLLHELAHIFLGVTSISNINTSDAINDKERICNTFAAEFLLPKQKISGIRKLDNIDDIINTASNIASQYHVSLMVVIRRLYDSDKIKKELYDQANGIIISSISQNKKDKAKTDVKVSRNVLDKAYLGKKTIQTINLAIEQQLILPSTAAAILGINVIRLYKAVL